MSQLAKPMTALCSIQRTLVEINIPQLAKTIDK